MIDCAEARALVASLAGLDDEVRQELESLGPCERRALALAARRVAEECESMDRAPTPET